MDTTPYWQKQHPNCFQFAALSEPAHFDVVIIGGGITGLTAGWLLKQSGKRVCVLERGRIGHGETGHTTAHLTQVTDQHFSRIYDYYFGGPEADLVWSGGAAAIDFIESQVLEYNIDCNFQRVPGFLMEPLFAFPDYQLTHLKRDAELANRAGWPAQYLSMVPGFHKSGVLWPDQARFDPPGYLMKLAQLIDGDGSRVFEKTDAEILDSRSHRVAANGVTLECEDLVIATHVPPGSANNLLAAVMLQSKIYPYTTYAISGTMPKGQFPEALYWDTGSPYYYLRVDEHEADCRFIFGGEDHKTGQVEATRSPFEWLEEVLRRFAAELHIDSRWSGQVIETNDGLPYIGEIRPHQFVATGFSGNGMTFGTLAGLMACDSILKRSNPWSDLFSIDRRKVRGGLWKYLSENVDYPYYMLRDWFTRGAQESPENIRRGEGRVLTVDGQRIACSRDKSGVLHQVRAQCTHMGCLVRWNEAEHTWDCPCHGSRFAMNGEVIAGPAATPLPSIQPPESSAAPVTSSPAPEKSQAADALHAGPSS